MRRSIHYLCATAGSATSAKPGPNDPLVTGDVFKFFFSNQKGHKGGKKRRAF